MEFVETQKGREALHMDGYKFVLHRRNANDVKVWRCTKYWTIACRVTLATQHAKLVNENEGVHNHPPDAREVLVAKAKQSLRRKWRREQALKAAGVGERRESSKKGAPSSWKHFKRMESLLGTRAALRELEDSQDTAGEEGTEDSETDRILGLAPLGGCKKEDENLTGAVLPRLKVAADGRVFSMRRQAVHICQDASHETLEAKHLERKRRHATVERQPKEVFEDTLATMEQHAPPYRPYADSEGGYIVPTTTSDLVMPSTSSDATSSIRLGEVRSLADPTALSADHELLFSQIKEEVTDDHMGQEPFQTASSSSSVTATVTSSATPLVIYSHTSTNSPPQPTFQSDLPTNDLSDVSHHKEPAAQPSIDATPSAEPSLGHPTPACAFNMSRKRPATPWMTTVSVAERKAKVELEILLAQRRKMELELRKFEADERKVAAETLLLAEQTKRCEEEKKKLKAEAEYFVQEKVRSEEETRKAAAKADLLLEHKNFYREQQKTETVRRRMLLLEMRKMKHDLKLLQ